MTDRLTRELCAILDPLQVQLESSEQSGLESGAETTYPTWCYQVADILSLAVVQMPENGKVVVCRTHHRRAFLSRELVQALVEVFRLVCEHLPEQPEQAAPACSSALLWIEPLYQKPAEVALLCASAPVVRLTRDALADLKTELWYRLHRLACDEAHCFYAVEQPWLEGLRHLMLPDHRSVCHPALCGAFAPPNPMPWSGYWFLFPAPAESDPRDEAANGVDICSDCLIRWQAMQQQGKE